MSIAPSPRRRLSPDESRSVALDAARALLIETGPQSVTLKAVAGRVGRTHANLLHHFGSAAGLQKALAERMAELGAETLLDGPEPLAARMRAEVPLWQSIATRAGIPRE